MSTTALAAVDTASFFVESLPSAVMVAADGSRWVSAKRDAE